MKKQIYILIEWLATAATILGFWMLGEYGAIGYTVAGVGNVLWIIWALPKKAGGLIAVNVIMAIIAINGLIRII